MVDDDETITTDEQESSLEEPKPTDDSLSRLQKLKQKLFPPKEKDGLTFRQRLTKAGLSVVLSYGWVSNVSSVSMAALSWYVFNRRTGLSPLAPGQWKPYLAIYAGFYVFNNIIRPLRFAFSVSVSMYFDRIIAYIQEKFGVGRGVAIGLTVFLANVVGTCSLLAFLVSVASAASGVPIFPPKA